MFHSFGVYGPAFSVTLGRMTAETVEPWVDPETGWHPTAARPFPPVQCTSVTRHGPNAGQRCRAYAVYGATVCIVHGAQLPQVRHAAEERKLAQQLRIMNAVDDAIDALEYLVNNAVAEGVRLKTATEILDRAGIRGGTELDVRVDDRTDAGSILRQRINDLQNRVKIIDGDTVTPPALEESDDG